MIVAYRAIALGFGYVESHHTSWLMYSAETRLPSTRKEALCSLAKYLYNRFMANSEDSDDYNNKYKKHMAACCQQAWRKRDHDDPPTKCPTCEARYDIVVKSSFDVEEWHQYLRETASSDADSYGPYYENDNVYGWNPFMFEFDIPQNQMVIVHENAEHILTDALFDVHPELRPEDHYRSEYIGRDYDHICDESYVFNSYDYVKPEHSRFTGRKYKETIIHDYDNGGQAIITNGLYTSIMYNTGDKVWLEYKDGKYKVIRALTHDGIEFK